MASESDYPNESTAPLRDVSVDQSDQDQSSQRKSIWIKVIIAIVAVLAIILTLILIGVHSSKKKSSEGDGQSLKLVEVQHGSTIEYRIDQKGPCFEPTCINCVLNVLGPILANYSNPKECNVSDEPEVKNASCYMCNNECKSFEEMQDKITRNIISIQCRGQKRIDCCIVSHMGNMGGYCGTDGQFNCYMDGPAPVCYCPAGKSGPRCENTYTQPVLCRCFNSPYKFCDEERMAGCNNDTRTTNSTECQTYLRTNTVTYNCLCTPLDGTLTQPVCPKPTIS